MFDELVKEAKRLFSSKKNGGKQVGKLTNQLHGQKQVLLALSLVLLLGYSQFRAHFKCQGIEGVDEKVVTDFCLINGTTTVVRDNNLDSSLNQGASLLPAPPRSPLRKHRPKQPANAQDSDSRLQSIAKPQRVPHVGLGVMINDSDDRVIHHNYMRSLWALFILLAMCSYFAQRDWASIFDDEMLQALLQLPGHQESRLARAASAARPYELLAGVPSTVPADMQKETLKLATDKNQRQHTNELLMRRIELIDKYVNIYDHKLDYYPNQLIYLLLTKNVAAYKLSRLSLGRRLLQHGILSAFCTLSQFVLPIFFIGREYSTFGWQYFEAFLAYASKLLTSREPIMTNSVDYEISSVIFPISTQCDYQQYGVTGQIEHYVTQCTVAINEICSKLFVVIWWVVSLNLFPEFGSLLHLSLCSLSTSTLKKVTGRSWPNRCNEVDFIASFRHKRAALLAKKHSSERRHLRDNIKLSNQQANLRDKDQKIALNDGDLKRLEAEGKLSVNKDGNVVISSDSTKKWYLWCPRDVCNWVSRVICCSGTKRGEKLEQEPEIDKNIYYLLYLLHLRLGKSPNKTEQVIRMTASALENYLDELALDLKDLSDMNQDEDDDDEQPESNHSLDAAGDSHQTFRQNLRDYNLDRAPDQQADKNSTIIDVVV